MSDLVGLPALLEDHELTLVAYGSQDGPVDPVRTESILLRRCSAGARAWLIEQGIAGAPGALRIRENPEVGLTSRLCVPARFEGRNHGYFWFLDTEVEEATLAEAERIAARAGERLARDLRLGRRVEESLRRLLESGEEAEEFARLASVSVAGATVAIRLRFADEDEAQRFVASLPSRAGLWAAYAGQADAGVLARGDLAGERERRALADRLARLSDDAPATGIGSVAGSLTEVHRSWAQAGIALNGGLALDERIADWAGLGIRRLLGLADPAAVRQVLDLPALEELIADPRSAALVRTALVYLDLGASAKHAAEALGIHRQTLYYRLSAVEDRTGLSLADGRDRLLLHLALTLLGPAVGGAVSGRP